MLGDQLCARARGLCMRTYTIYNDAPGIVVLHGLKAKFTVDHLVKALVLPHDIFLTAQALILPSLA